MKCKALPDGFEWIFISSETPEVEIYKTCLELNNYNFTLVVLLFFRFPSSKLLFIKSLPHTTGNLIESSLLGMTQSVKIKGKLLKIAYVCPKGITECISNLLREVPISLMGFVFGITAL